MRARRQLGAGAEAGLASPPARFAAWERDERGARRAAGCAQAMGARCHRGPARFPRGGLRRELCGARAGGERVNTAKQAGFSAALLAARREKITRGDAVPSRGRSPPAAPGTFPLPEGPAGFIPCYQGWVGSREVARLRTGGCGWDLGLGIEPSGAQRLSHQRQAGVGDIPSPFVPPPQAGGMEHAAPPAAAWGGHGAER